MRALALGFVVFALFAPPQGPEIVPTLNEGTKSELQLGEELFAGNCVRCHGIAGRGQLHGAPNLLAPPLADVGERAADFYLRTGYMPLAESRDQPVRTRPRFKERDLQAMIAYVGSLGKGPKAPTPHYQGASVEQGRELFTDHCAGCHQVVAEGGVMTGAKAPPLEGATPQQIAEAVRIGPYAMPPFTAKAISPEELNAIIAYVQYAKNPDDAGGWGINHLGPFPEGMVTWLIAAVVLVLTCIVVSRRRSEA